MKAFAVTYGDRKVDPSTGISLGDEVFTGVLYVFAVYPKLSRAWVVAEPADVLHDHSRVRVGDYVLMHTGYAISIVDEDEAAETMKLLKELGEAS